MDPQPVIDVRTLPKPTFKKIPREVWTSIFGLVVQAEFKDYLKAEPDGPIRSTALVISQVNQSWRYIALEKRRLWKYVAVYARKYWPGEECAHFARCVERAGYAPTLVCNTLQS